MDSRVKGTAPGAEYVREMFGRIARRYDFVNHLLSLQIDRSWRKRVAKRFRHILERPGARVLDLCCGTGDLGLALAWRAAPAAHIFGADFSHPMLQLARNKFQHHHCEPLLVEGDALKLPFPDGAFDLITIAFGFRNLADYRAGLREILRVLAPGGEVGILEFSSPDSPVFASIYGFYFSKILPRIGAAISGDSSAYRYLRSSVADFPLPAGLAEMLKEEGFATVGFQKFTGGIAYLHSARRP